MAKFVYVYTGGQPPQTQDELQETVQQWGTWLDGLGASVIDRGNAFAASATVKSGGSAAGGTSGLGGYSIVQAGSLDEALERTSGCPILRHSDGAVEVYEVHEM